MKRFFNRTISSILIVSVLTGSCFFATPVLAQNNANVSASGQAQNEQATGYRYGIDPNATNYADAAGNVAGGAVACAAGQILGQLLTSTISSGITGLLGSAGISTTGTPRVPVDYTGTPAEQQSRARTSATTGSLDPTGFTLIQPSWDSIAWCVINSIIEYIIDATIQWAKTGFNGNPAFIDNPEQFFESIADQEAGAFIQEIVRGTTGINVCEPFRVQIGINLANAYGQKNKRLSCSLDRIQGNFENFASGDFIGQGGWDTWYGMTQVNANNPIGAYAESDSLLRARLAVQDNTAKLELGWNNGFLNFKKCEDRTDPKTCVTSTPGTLLQSSLEKSLGIPKDRLVLAQKFDQLVTVLINSLIKVALNEVLDGSGDDN